MRKVKILVGVTVMACMALLAACGGKKLQTSLSLEDAYCPQGKDLSGAVPEVLKIESYEITISGDDFEPITVTLDGKTASAPVEEIPKGENRTLLIEAKNNRGQVICRRELTGIEIKGGKIALVEISLLAVPFVANISNGNVVTQTRLTFDGYGEPVGAVQIIDTFNGEESILTDLITSADLVSPSSADATFQFKPAVLPIGEHLFTVRDFQTGEQSQVTVTLVAPGRAPGTGLSIAGFIGTAGAQTVGRNDNFVEALEALSK
ncbi:MAG TPA: hypothetical protein VLJ37_01660 [bacterium]|nr:hypothetical protein [bacterium]